MIAEQTPILIITTVHWLGQRFHIKPFNDSFTFWVLWCKLFSRRELLLKSVNIGFIRVSKADINVSFFFFFFFYKVFFFFFFFFFFFLSGFFFFFFFFFSFFYLFLLSDLIAIYTSCSRFWSKIDDAVHHIHFLNNERALPQWVLYIDVIHRWNISLFCLIAIPK